MYQRKTSAAFRAALLSALIAITILSHGATATCMGCVELDEISFDKIISHFKYTLVKFDIAFPYGAKHEIYGEFAKSYGPKIDDMLTGLVGVKDYGEKENSKIAERYNVDEKAYPEIILFLNSDNQNYVKYPKDLDITVDNLKKFVSLHTNIYLPLDGCLESLDMLALDFVDKSKEEQRLQLEKALKEVDNFQGEENKVAKIYVRLMEKAIASAESSQYIVDERKRVKKLLNEKLTDTKKKELTYRQNILQSFRIASDLDGKRDEL